MSSIISELLLADWLRLSRLTQYIIYSIEQFINGAAVNSMFCVSFTLLIEWTSVQHTQLVSSVNLCFFVLGQTIVMLVAAFTRNWHLINWFVDANVLLCLIVCICYLPESTRYMHDRQYDTNFNFKKAFPNETKLYKKFSKLIISSRNQLIKVFLLSIIWFSITMIYYGVSFGMILSLSANIRFDYKAFK